MKILSIRQTSFTIISLFNSLESNIQPQSHYQIDSYHYFDSNGLIISICMEIDYICCQDEFNGHISTFSSNKLKLLQSIYANPFY